MLAPVPAIRVALSVQCALCIAYERKEWNGTCDGEYTRPAFEKDVHMKFVNNNKLGVDDICVFEVVEATSYGAKVKVVILKGPFDLPDELLEEKA